jgi:hypothetical protein
MYPRNLVTRTDPLGCMRAVRTDPRTAKLPARALRALWTAVEQYARDGGWFHVARTRWAKEAGTGTTTLDRAIVDLQQAGVLEVWTAPRGWSGPNLYRLTAHPEVEPIDPESADEQSYELAPVPTRRPRRTVAWKEIAKVHTTGGEP